jgi:hypothetical protein
MKSLWKSIWAFLKILKIEPLYYPAIPLLGIVLKDSRTAQNKDTCTPMFTVALYTID